MIPVHISTCAWREVEVGNMIAIQRIRDNPRLKITWSVGLNDALIERSRSTEATKFLFNRNLGDVFVSIDTDILFEPQDFMYLVQDIIAGYDIVGGIYVTRNHEAPKIAIRMPEKTHVTLGEGSPVEATYLSSGFMAVHRKVFEKLATTLPLCRTGKTGDFYPFYMAFPVQNSDGSHEFLSEDWGMNYLARQQGFKCWADPRCRIGHLGLRSYWVNDVNVDDLADSYVSITEGRVDKTNIIQDLAAYWKLSIPEVWEKLKAVPADITTQEWNNKSPSARDDVLKFYSTNDSYLPALARFNLRPNYWERVRMLLSVSGNIADFGGGIGSLCCALTNYCREVNYIDLAGKPYDFAKFRFSRLPLDRKQKIKMHTSLENLKNLDYVISSDVLEHIHPDDLPVIVKQMYDALKPKGCAVVISDFGVSDRFPMHFSTEGDFAKLMQEVGFQEGPIRWIKP